MKSPRFDSRAAPLKRIFSAPNIERVWKDKVRVSMRQQYLNDGIENLDFHTNRARESEKLSQLILSGGYKPARADRILMEKSKGLCRQIVVPAARDALVLQVLSDALYSSIRGRAPSNRSFFEPSDHRFSEERSTYGTFAAWLNFQRAIFRFSEEKKFLVVTDVANYYDTISYTHLRNVISGLVGVEECVLDMLIFVLSDLLWQPDYSPRIDVGLPQMNLDAPRLLAHCFLYELDEYLKESCGNNFVRFMDDIDMGADSIVEARKLLQAVDLVLQTRQIRLNSGKTKILTQEAAARHFRIRENRQLDVIKKTIARKVASGRSLDRARRVVVSCLAKGIKRKAFDEGNGEKILKRWLGLAMQIQAHISPATLGNIISLRPGAREKALSYIARTALTSARAEMLSRYVASGQIIDDVTLVDIANGLVETLVVSRSGRHDHIDAIVDACDPKHPYTLYCKLWLQSKYAPPSVLFNSLLASVSVWRASERLGRLVGSFASLFEIAEKKELTTLVIASGNLGARETLLFHHKLSSDADTFLKMFDMLRAPNRSRPTGITHAKFLCLLSALRNDAASAGHKRRLRMQHQAALGDIYYRQMLRRVP